MSDHWTREAVFHDAVWLVLSVVLPHLSGMIWRAVGQSGFRGIFQVGRANAEADLALAKYISANPDRLTRSFVIIVGAYLMLLAGVAVVGLIYVALRLRFNTALPAWLDAYVAATMAVAVGSFTFVALQALLLASRLSDDRGRTLRELRGRVAKHRR